MIGAIASLEHGKGVPLYRIRDCFAFVGDPQRAPKTQSGMKLKWCPEAVDDLVSLRAHISPDDPAAAERVALHILHCIEKLLPPNPQLGRPVACPAHANSLFRKRPLSFPIA